VRINLDKEVKMIEQIDHKSTKRLKPINIPLNHQLEHMQAEELATKAKKDTNGTFIPLQSF
jgi:hypothetical protein